METLKLFKLLESPQIFILNFNNKRSWLLLAREYAMPEKECALPYVTFNNGITK